MAIAVVILRSPASVAPKCDDATALNILKDQGHDNLTGIVTLTVDDKAENVTCKGIEGQYSGVSYRVARTTDGQIAVIWQAY